MVSMHNSLKDVFLLKEKAAKYYKYTVLYFCKHYIITSLQLKDVPYFHYDKKM